MSGHTKVIHAQWEDEAGRRRVNLRCACGGWTATTPDGWDALAEFYGHAGFPGFPLPAETGNYWGVG